MLDAATMQPSRCNPKRAIPSLVAALSFLVAGAVQAFPALNLTPGTPNIDSVFITVDYIGNNTTGILTASGFASALTPPGSPIGNISGGSFDIAAAINANAQTANGSLAIGGTVAVLGFNSGTLLTGVVSSTAGDPTFGAGAGDPLEFLFDVTGGDAAGLFGGIGSSAGVILIQSGYSGSFDSNFSSGPFQARANTFVPEQAQEVPEPGILGLLLLGGGALAWRRRKQTQLS